jgi:uncharacterized protein (TIGR00251 family)
MALDIRDKDDGLRFRVRVKPRASKSAIVGVKVDELEVAVAAPPVDGAANEELVRTLAAALGVARRQIAIVSGEASRTKLVQVTGIDEASLRAKLKA